MLHIELDPTLGLAVLKPEGTLAQSDFENAAGLIDPLIEANGKLNGLLIVTKSFPGWDSFAALSTHLKFVRDHHKHISKVALVTDSAIGGFGESIARHFVAAEIKHFAFSELENAKMWITKAT